jgi:hypothetical protein
MPVKRKTNPEAPLPWAEPVWTRAECVALKHLAAGTADEFAQKRALDWIVNVLCETYGLSFRPSPDGGQRATDFASGKQFVGQQIVRLINANPEKATKES